MLFRSTAGDEFPVVRALERMLAMRIHMRARHVDGVVETKALNQAGITREQVEEYDREGYLFFPALFTPDEVRVLNAEVPKLYAEIRPENVREKDSNAVRTNFAAHTYNEAYRRLARHPRLIGPASQILDDGVYIHQFKINGKAAFDGDVWQWHQDYGTWFNDDDMPEARAMNVAEIGRAHV